jgi:hypothetical protein
LQIIDYNLQLFNFSEYAELASVIIDIVFLDNYDMNDLNTGERLYVEIWDQRIHAA